MRHQHGHSVHVHGRSTYPRQHQEGDCEGAGDRYHAFAETVEEHEQVYKNKVAEEALKIERESTTGKFEEVAALVSGKRGKEVFVNGDANFGVSPLLPCPLPFSH